jgi:hypothetical protein
MYLETGNDFDVDEIFDSMDKKEKKEMMELLCEEFEVDNPLEKVSGKAGMILPEEIDFRNNLDHLKRNYMRLTPEEIMLIKQISNRL